MTEKMMLRTKKSSEFFARSGELSCGRFLRQSNDLLITGSQNSIIRLWRIHQPSPIWSINAHSNVEVSAIACDEEYNRVVSASIDGCIRVWDLKHAGALVRSMDKSARAVTTLDAHPYGVYVASGYQDGKIKVWDSRVRTSIATYCGHRSTIMALRHSPDGQWIASADTSGIVKIWSLTQGKLLCELSNQHRTSVSSLAFHPKEFVLGIGIGTHSDLELSFLEVWSLESWTQLPQRDTEVNAASSYPCCIAFDDTKSFVYSASTTALMCSSIEPSVTPFVNILVPWEGLIDLMPSCTDNNKLRALCLRNTTAIVYDVIEHKKNTQQNTSQRLASKAASSAHTNLPHVYVEYDDALICNKDVKGVEHVTSAPHTPSSAVSSTHHSVAKLHNQEVREHESLLRILTERMRVTSRCASMWKQPNSSLSYALSRADVSVAHRLLKQLSLAHTHLNQSMPKHLIKINVCAAFLQLVERVLPHSAAAAAAAASDAIHALDIILHSVRAQQSVVVQDNAMTSCHYLLQHSVATALHDALPTLKSQQDKARSLLDNIQQHTNDT